MAVTVGRQASVTSWATSTFLTNLIDTLVDPVDCTFDYDADEIDVTAYAGGSLIYDEQIPGLKNCLVAQITGVLATPITAIGGAVAFSGGYVTNAFNWTWEANCDVIEATAFGSPTHYSYIPGVVSWGGTFDAYVDGTTALVAPGAGAAAATFTLSSGNTIGGNIFATRLGVGLPLRGANTARYSYRGVSTVTFVGSANIAAAGTLATPETGKTLTLTSATSRTYATEAFWSKIAVSAPLRDRITCEVTAQGTGAVTIG